MPASGLRLPDRPARKVLYLVDTLLGSGGTEGALLRMVRHLPRYGYECSIATFDISPNRDFLESFPCPIHDLRLARIYDFNALKVAVRLWNLIRTEKFDVVHAMFPTSELWGIPIARAARDVLTVSGRRDLGVVRRAKHGVAYRLMSRWFDQIQAVSNAAAETAIRKDGVDPQRVFTVHNGVEIDQIDKIPPHPDLVRTFDLDPRGAIVLTAVGTVWPVKGIDVVIRAAAEVCRHLPHTNFLIAGYFGSPFADPLLALVRELGIEKNIRFIGRLKEILSIAKASDVSCLLSRSEGLSNAMLEAMACRLPCVATDVGGNPEVLKHGETGFLVPNEDHAAAASRLLQLLENPPLRRRMGQNGRDVVEEKFSAEVMIRRVASLYDSAIESKRQLKKGI